MPHWPFSSGISEFDVEVAGKLLPADLHWPGYEIGSTRRLALGFHPKPPLPLERQSAQHTCFAGPCRGTADRVVGGWRVPEIRKDIDTPVLDCGGRRILVFINHVLIDRQIHQLVDLRI